MLGYLRGRLKTHGAPGLSFAMVLWRMTFAAAHRARSTIGLGAATTRLGDARRGLDRNRSKIVLDPPQKVRETSQELLGHGAF